MQWHPRSEDKAAWSAAGGVVMAVGAGGAIAWLAIAEPTTSHEPLWPVYAFAVVALIGLYGMLAPLLHWWPWRERDRGRRTSEAVPSTSAQPLLAAARAHAASALPEKRFHYDLAAEQAREREVVRDLHAEYVRTHEGLSPHVIAGLTPLPGDWVVRRLKEMGETFRWSEYKP